MPEWVLGRLGLDALPQDQITIGGGIMMVAGALFAAGAITYFGKWKWLWKEWLTTLDPKKIGIMYLLVAVLMLFRGLADALMMRAVQATNDHVSGMITTDTFQQVFSAHGTIMIFFVAMGVVFGLVNLILPLQIGARDVAFPFLNATSFWLFVAGMVMMNTSLVIGGFAATGWLAYPPLSELEYSPGAGVDYWIWSLQIAGVGSLLSGVNFLVTIFKMRRKGMSLMKMPIFVWSVMGSMLLVVFAFPILTATLGMLSLDRTMGMHFFTSDGGGNAMMYINLIWAWGHPEVYILILPAFGVFSEVVATFSHKRLFGYTSMVVAIAAIAFLSFVVWLHHFFTMGGGANVNAFFGIMTMIIGVPTGVKVFNWLFTMYRGKVEYTTPMMWFLGFVVTFTLGGVAGVLLAVPAIDFQLHNSLFLVAHFHTMIIGGVLFGFFAALTYWWPKVFGFRLNERLGKYAFWCWLLGFMTAFVPLYVLGFMGATRRLDHYDPSTGWQGLFIVAGVGVAIMCLGVLFQIIQVAYSIWKRNETRDLTGDPWDGRTLEWSVPSPVPVYSFASTPAVHERDAWWAMKQSKKHPHPIYEDVSLPTNSSLGLFIAAGAFMAGFGIVWHMWWLAVVGVVVVIVTLIVRSLNDEPEYTISAKEIEKADKARRAAV